MRRPVELPYASVPSFTAQPLACGSKFQLNPSSWARAVPVSRLRLASSSIVRSCNRRAHSPFHSITTTELVERIGDGLAETPSEVVKQPTSSPKDAGGRVWPWRGDSRPLPDVTSPCRPRGKLPQHATFEMQDGLYSSCTHCSGAVRLSLESMGRNPSSIRAHGPK